MWLTLKKKKKKKNFFFFFGISWIPFQVGNSANSATFPRSRKITGPTGSRQGIPAQLARGCLRWSIFELGGFTEWWCDLLGNETSSTAESSHETRMLSKMINGICSPVSPVSGHLFVVMTLVMAILMLSQQFDTWHCETLPIQAWLRNSLSFIYYDAVWC